MIKVPEKMIFNSRKYKMIAINEAVRYRVPLDLRSIYLLKIQMINDCYTKTIVCDVQPFVYISALQRKKVMQIFLVICID